MFWSLLGAFVLSVQVASAEEEEGGGAIVIELDDEEEDEADEQEEAGEEGERRGPVRLGRIDVIGVSFEELESVPGSASVVTSEDLEFQRPLDAGEVIRTMPGVHFRDEEGMGLRPNIGIRGLDPSRSRTLLVLEDGVPVALAPYGEPEMYYSPAIERIERLELVKGSGSILWGPQTIGGVLNYITKDPPEDFTVTAELRGGQYGYLLGQATVGDTVGRVGYFLSVMHRRYDGYTAPRSLDLRLTDVTGKVRVELSDDASLTFKGQVYDEHSRATYLGLTQEQFETDRRSNFAIHDELPVRRYALSAIYEQFLGENLFLQTTIYGHNITRNWNRQDFDRVDGDRDYERIIDGQGRDVTAEGADADDRGAFFFRDTMSSRNREFFIGGIEPRLTADYSFGAVDNELIVGARVHGELTHESRVDSPLADPDDQTVRAAEVRRGVGVAGYVLNRFMFLDQRLTVSPGVRVENFWNEREITRDRIDGVPTDLEPSVVNSDNTFAVIPGIGVAYSVIDELTVFGGVHRGFAPPRTKDAVTADGELLELEAEYSVNYEIGVRGQLEDWLRAEVAGFVLDFSNQIIPPSEYGGAVSGQPGGLINAGETRHFGVESQLVFDGATMADLGFALPLGVSYTYVHAVFGDQWQEEIAGNRVPYAPEHRLAGFLRFAHPVGVAAQVNGTFISEQFTDKGNTVEADATGLVGQLDPYFLLDANLSYTYRPWGITAFVAGKNLTDEYYIASRAPQGIMPGAPRQVFGGVRGQW